MMTEVVKRKGIYLPLDGQISDYTVTHPAMYKYFPPRYFHHYPTVWQKGSGLMFITNTDSIYWGILHWWYLCALDRDCIAPNGHKLNCKNWQTCVKNDRPVCWIGCHRYEQSAISILYNNYLFSSEHPNLTASTTQWSLGKSGSFGVIRRPTSMFKVRECMHN